MPVHDAADPRWDEEPAQCPEARVEPPGRLDGALPSGVNPHSPGGKFTYAETTQDAMHFIRAVCNIVMPEDYVAKGAVFVVIYMIAMGGYHMMLL